jgi:hypothetical protein
LLKNGIDKRTVDRNSIGYMENKAKIELENKFFLGIVGFCFLGIGIYLGYVENFKWRNLFISERATIFFLYILFTLIIWGGGLWIGFRNNWQTDPTQKLQKIPKIVRYAIAVFLLLTPSILILFTHVNDREISYYLRIILSLACVFLSVPFVYPKISIQKFFKKVILFGFFAGVIFSIYRIFNQVTSYPFSLGWSEGNRIWDYSVLFGSNRYVTIDNRELFAFTDPGRAFVWGIPFIYSKLNIYWFRFYDAAIKTSPFFLLGIVSIWTKRKEIGKWGVFLFGLWTFMFLLQGLIHPPLIFIAILTFFAVRQRNLIFSMFLVMVAGYLAFVSRFSWAYAPGLWAGILSLLQLETPKFNKENLSKLWPPVFLGIAGLIGGRYLSPILDWISSGGESIIGSLSLIDPITGTTALSQALLWERWWPNPTYAPGIIFGILLTTGPIIILTILMIRKNHWKLNQLQRFGAFLPALAFLIVGLVASVKIGGGGDLHNLDMFLITMIFIASFYWPKLMEYVFDHENQKNHRIIRFVSILVFLMPVFWAFRSGNPLTGLFSEDRTEYILDSIQGYVDDVQAEGGEVLFMDQRQLITFGLIEDVILYDEYDKKLLIDSAFREDEEYFEKFYEDIESQKFELIVSEKLNLEEKNDNIFSNENNAWVNWVAIPLSEYYCPIMTVDNMNLQLMVPGTDCDVPRNY